MDKNQKTDTFDRVIDLTGEWTFYENQADNPEKYPAKVPGCVHQDLMQNTLIPDPFYRDNEKKVQWVGERDWCFEREFKINDTQLNNSSFTLICEGLDTYAKIYLNRHEVGATENMFRRYDFPVQHLLKPGTNKIQIFFTSPFKKVAEQVPATKRTLPSANEPDLPTAPYVRKAPYHFGWDWGPRLVTMGIWKSIYLEDQQFTKINQLHVHQSFKKQKKEITQVVLDIRCEIKHPPNCVQNLTAEIVLTQKENQISRTEYSLSAAETELTTSIKIDQPGLWWPNGYGKQSFYTVTIKLFQDELAIDRVTKRVGIRELILNQKEDKWGHAFEFIVNGVPIFIKGANWIPVDNFLPRITRERYEQLIRSSAQANMNMLRVWGGGIYEADAFYDLCDEYGMLIWQDFMFSCAQYPVDEPFLENVREEMKQAILRLKHHPCLALWCGNNEIEWGWESKLPPQLFKDYLKLFYQEIPDLVKQYDPDTNYWSSSPAGTNLMDANDQNSGDMHCWDVWHGHKPFTYFKEIHPRFLSEFGFQSFPLINYINKFTKPEEQNISHPVMEVHQKCVGGNKNIVQYMLDHYRMPKDFESFVWISQLLQAEGIKVGVEHIRSIRPRCMGSLYWQLNDCWPVASWASIDYEGTWKALNYYAKRFYAPVLIYPNQAKNRIELNVISDRKQSFKGQVNWQIMDLEGNTLESQQHENVEVVPLSSTFIETIDLLQLSAKLNKLSHFFHCWINDGDNLLSSNIVHFVPLKQIELPEPKIEINWQEQEDHFLIKLKSDVLVKHTYLELEGIEQRFSDNFFDMIPNQEKVVEVTKPTRHSMENLNSLLKITHLGLTY